MSEEQENQPVYKVSEKVAHMTLEEQLAIDAEDESVRRWKEAMLAGAGKGGDTSRPKLELEKIRVVFSKSAPVELDVSSKEKIEALQANDCLMEFHQGETYHLEVTFRVNFDMVPAIAFVQEIQRGVIKQTMRQTVGSFACRDEPFVYELKEQDVPSGSLARGNYTSHITFTDGDGNKWLDFRYKFKIVK